MRPGTRLALAATVLLALGVVYWWLSTSGALAVVGNAQALRNWVQDFGAWGPVLIIALMIVAIVMSPIPSGPVAIVAGAAFGPLWGTIYVSVGASLGAMIAFAIARTLGYDVVERWSRTGPLLERLKKHQSQNWLMLVVLGSRLVPFISFDAVSYAAGLTPLAFWRFALATLSGVIPVSFALAYFGESIAEADSPYMMAAAVLVGGAILIPIGWSLFRNKSKKKPSDTETPASHLPCEDRR